MDREPLIARGEIEAAFFALTICSRRFERSDACYKATMAKKKYKKIWNSKAEHDAWEAHVDETLRRLRAAIESIRARDERAKAAEG